MCKELAASGVPETVQHDDLHMANVYARGRRLRVLDWGDASISHPFASLLVTFRFIGRAARLPPQDPRFTRLRDAYLEAWGPGLTDVFALALRIAAFAHTFTWVRHRDQIAGGERGEFDRLFAIALRQALAEVRG